MKASITLLIILAATLVFIIVAIKVETIVGVVIAMSIVRKAIVVKDIAVITPVII